MKIRIMCLVKLISILLFAPVILNAQTSLYYKGVNWVTDLSWDEIISKAKSQKKNIFVDCFATWCGPCKWMDINVYPTKEVSEFINENFISVKIQMDKTSNDNQNIKSTYALASFFKQEYNITSYPTFLFFSSEGVILHKSLGAKSGINFIGEVNDALNPDKQYYRLLKVFRQGIIDKSKLKRLAIDSRKFGDNDLANKLATLYLDSTGESALQNKEDLYFMKLFKNCTKSKELANEYINKLSEKDLYTKENIEFMVTFIATSNDRIFNILYNKHEKVNSVMKDNDYAQRSVRYIIKTEEILPYWKIAQSNKKTKLIKWHKIRKSIRQKYNNEYAKRCILEGKVAVYSYNALQFNIDWKKYIKYNLQLLETYGSDTTKVIDDAMILNNFAWHIFLHSKKNRQLNKAIKWMEGVIRRAPDNAPNIDTYANLLYKIGKKQKSLEYERKALAIALDTKEDHLVKSYKERIMKIQKGDPTW